MANSVSGTGQGSYEIQEDLQQALHALTDGFILIARDGKIVFMNREAKSILGQNAGSPSITRLEILMGTGGYDWTEVYEAIRGSKTIDHILRGGYRSSVLVSGRRATQPEGAVVLTLRDLEVFDYNRKIASGVVTKNETVSFERRVRPDFARQRQISPYLDKIISRGERALLQGARVIITGESGVGKTEIARHLHHFVANAGDPFVVVNCAAIPESLFESELFGYAKGSFTGALTSGKEGLIERAEGGTLFLDEVGEIPIHLQAKLLSFLEDRFVQRVGGSRPKRFLQPIEICCKWFKIEPSGMIYIIVWLSSMFP